MRFRVVPTGALDGRRGTAARKCVQRGATRVQGIEKLAHTRWLKRENIISGTACGTIGVNTYCRETVEIEDENEDD